MQRRLTLIFGLLMALSLAMVPAASAHGNKHHPKPLPTRIDLPDGFQPEGIASGSSGKLYVGSVADGAIWKGSAKSGTGRILVPGAAGHAAAGLHLDGRGRLWVAGATDGTIRVYASKTGTLLREYTFPTAGFINDLTITRKGVYATDSLNPQLLVVPLGKHGQLAPTSAATTRALTGDIAYGPGFNANGIVSSAGWLVLVQSNTGKLFRVAPRTGVTKAIDTHGYSVVNGDGLVLRGRALYVVRNQNDLVAKLHLSKRLTSAKLVRELTAPGLDVPTTATFALGKLYVVNARFGVANPDTADYWITRLKTH